jgi:lipoyl(octanoyl) transferase
VPCGIATHGVTSLQALGLKAGMAELDQALEAKFPDFLAKLG